MIKRLYARHLRPLWTDPNGTIALVVRLFSENFREHIGAYVIAMGCMAVAAGATAASAWLMRYVVNDIFVDQSTSTILPLSLAVIGLSAARGFATYGHTVALGRIGTSVVAKFQKRIVEKLLTLRLDYFSRQHSSKFVARVANNVRAAQSAMLLVATSLGRDLLTVVLLAVVMITQDPLMSLLALSIAPPVIYGVLGIVRKIKAIAAAELESMAAVIRATQETVLGMRVVKAFTLEEQMRARISSAAANAERRANAINKAQASVSPLMESLGGISIGLVVLYAGWQTTAGGQTPGEFMAFMAAFLLAYEPAKRLAQLNVKLQRNLRAVRMIYDLLDSTAEEADAAEAVKLEKIDGNIKFDDVSFRYAEDTPVIQNVSMHASPGEVVALVGPSGAGKTTIMSILQRFYEPDSGVVSIDDIDIHKVTIDSLRQKISLVSQDTFLFSGSIYDNIALGRPGATKQEVEVAAAAALATDFIEKLPKGFDSVAGENGVMLSGGQRQRLAIARALLRDAPILLLDEATSAIDTESERQVREAIRRLMTGRTTIVIAHRLSTVVDADRIYVLEKGRVVGSGRHQQLIAENPLYRSLFGGDPSGNVSAAA